MSNGYWGKVLRINLTNETSKTEEISPDVWKQVLGGAGFGAKVLLEEASGNIDALSPDNKMIFAVGLYQACKTPGSAKWSVVTKSPLTGTYLDSAAGGDWGILFKKSGYDALIIEGESKEPVNIYISNDKVEFHSASDIWGLDTYSSNEYIQDEFKISKKDKISAVTIGPAGEIKNPIANIVCDGHSFAGRGGSGAVMGAKKLKAIIVHGDKLVDVNSKTAEERASKLMNKVAKDGKDFREAGTPSAVIKYEKIGNIPIKYWTGDRWEEGAKKISHPVYTEELNAKPEFCINCPVGCHRHIELKEPEKWALEGPGPEYETLALMGVNLLNDDLPSICKANEICNKMGIDTISAGAFIGFLMECYEKGIITEEDTDGLEIEWGDEEIVVELTRQIAELEGLGKLFSNGIVGAADKLGKDAEKLIVHVKNLDIPAHDPRATFGAALDYATGTRGACHERGDAQRLCLGEMYPELNLDDKFDPFSMEEAPEAAFVAQNISALYNSVSMCKFMPAAVGMQLTEINNLLNDITGWDWSIEEMVKAGERIYNLQRLVNVRDGIRREDDQLPPKMFESAQEGRRAGKVPQPFDEALDKYYELRGWDKEGIPTVERLKKLNLEEYIKYVDCVN